MNQYSSEKYVLIKDQKLKWGYFIMDKESKFSLVEDNNLAEEIIKKLLNEKVEIFDSFEEYNKKYPSTPLKYRKAKGMLFWWYQIPKKKWPLSVIDYFENDQFWKEFYVKYDVDNKTIESFE